MSVMEALGTMLLIAVATPKPKPLPADVTKTESALTQLGRDRKTILAEVVDIAKLNNDGRVWS